MKSDSSGIRGFEMRISKHIIVTSTIQDRFIVDAAGIGGRKKLLPGEVLLVEIQPVRSQQRPY
jgi:hypothetical protein